MKVDDENWHVLTVSRRDPETGEYTMERAPCYHLVADDQATTSGQTQAQKLSA
jgi:adenylylsulfate reductase subunit A